MKKNKVICFHAVTGQYIENIVDNGIQRESSAIFFGNNITKKSLFATLQVLIYHGISLRGWDAFSKSSDHNFCDYLNNVQKGIYIIKCYVNSDDAEKLEQHQSQYIMRDNQEIVTMQYAKVSSIDGIVPEQIASVMKLKIGDEFSNFPKESYAKDEKRFFCKSIEDDRFFSVEGIHNRDIKKFCYDTAKKNWKDFEVMLHES